MIDEVTFEKTTYAKLPNKFEAGTPNISGVIASGIAIDYINNIGLKTILKYENALLKYATEKLLEIDGIKNDAKVSFKNLSKSGKIVNAYNALILASRSKRK